MALDRSDPAARERFHARRRQRILTNRGGLSPIVGYLFAGLLVGPHMMANIEETIRLARELDPEVRVMVRPNHAREAQARVHSELT